MAVLTPVECKITNFAEFFDSATSFPAPNFPQDADNSRGNHTITISETIFVDKTDYKTNEEGGNDLFQVPRMHFSPFSTFRFRT